MIRPPLPALPLIENCIASSRLIKFRDKYERIFVKLIGDLDLPSGLPERHIRLMILGAMNWSPTWYRPGGEKPEVIAASFAHALKSGQK